MDVNQMSATGKVNSDAQNKDREKGWRAPNETVVEEVNRDPRRELAAFEVDGLLLSSLSKEAQEVIDKLVNRIEFLRQELEKAKGRETHYRKISEVHQFLEVPSRAVFLQKLRQIIMRSEDMSDPTTLVMVNIKNGDSIRHIYGRETLDNVLRNVVETIFKCIENIGILGSLGGNDFGVIFLNIKDVQVISIMNEIEHHLTDSSILIDGTSIEVELLFSSKILTVFDTADQAIKSVDEILKKKF